MAQSVLGGILSQLDALTTLLCESPPRAMQSQPQCASEVKETVQPQTSSCLPLPGSKGLSTAGVGSACAEVLGASSAQAPAPESLLEPARTTDALQVAWETREGVSRVPGSSQPILSKVPGSSSQPTHQNGDGAGAVGVVDAAARGSETARKRDVIDRGDVRPSTSNVASADGALAKGNASAANGASLIKSASLANGAPLTPSKRRLETGGTMNNGTMNNVTGSAVGAKQPLQRKRRRAQPKVEEVDVVVELSD